MMIAREMFAIPAPILTAMGWAIMAMPILLARYQRALIIVILKQILIKAIPMAMAWEMPAIFALPATTRPMKIATAFPMVVTTA